MKRFALVSWVLLAAVFATAPASAMPLGLRTAMWGIAAAQRGGDEPPAPGPSYGTPIFTIVDGVLTEVDLNGATDVVIPESVTNVAAKVFYQCDELRKVTIPASVTYIDLDAFGNCTSLKEVIFEEGSDGLTLVYPFAGTALTDLNLPARWNSLANGNPFQFCAALTNVTVTPGNTTFAIVNGLLLSADGKTVYGALGGVSEIEIPESVETIAYRSLYGLPHVEDIVFPDTVSKMFGQCVSYCASLQSIVIEGAVEVELWDRNPLFSECPNLKSVYFYGNAPTGNGIQYIYQSVPSDLVTYVASDSTGWGVDIPGMWNGRRIEYADPAPPEPVPLDPSTIRIDTEASYETEADGSFTLDLGELIVSASATKVTVKGLPAGIKFDARTLVISGKATKPGESKVAVSATSATVKKPVTAEFAIVVPNLSSEALPNLDPGKDAYGTIVAGVALTMDLVDCRPEEGWTVKVAGLPSGLKFTAKDVMKKGSKEVEIPANTIYGVPTKTGTFTVTFTASKKGEANQVATITMKVEALPTWAQGAFTGYVMGSADGEPETWNECGFATMTVAANGKVSGKIVLGGKSWTFSAASFSRVETDPSSEAGSPKSLVVEAVAKSGKETMPVELSVSGGGLAETDLLNGVAMGTFGDDELKLYRNVWKDKATAAAAKETISRFAGVYTVALSPGMVGDCGSGFLSLTVGKDGNSKATGKLADGMSVSAASPLMYDEYDGWFVMLYAAPSAYKGGAFAAAVGFDAQDGSADDGRPPYRLGAVMFAPQWSSRNPQATGEYGEGFDRSVELSGAYYDKGDKLSAYYESLRVGLGNEGPELGFTFKETSINDQGKKVTTSSPDTAPAVDTLDQKGMTVAVTTDGKLVVEKATKPVQDRVTKEWSYEGANDGALALSFTQATGIFKGSYTFWYDYVSAYDETKDKATLAHASKKVSFEGILVQGEEPKMDGFYLWDATGEYEERGKTKTYKYKQSFPVSVLRLLDE